MVNTPKLKKILITGGSSLFFKFLKDELAPEYFESPKKKKFNKLNFKQMNN